MVLSQTAEYALRAMVVMAALPEGERIRSQELSDQTGIPAPYLSKIMRRMVLRGLVDAQRGHGGGFMLLRRPEEIHFVEVLVAVDYLLERSHCAFGLGNCNPDHPCALHDAWSRLSADVERWARTTTLRDTCPRPA